MAKTKPARRYKLSVKKGDTVQIIAGADKGKKGVVLEINPIKLKIKVQGVKIMTHFDKQQGKFTAEGFIDYSNVKMTEKAAAKEKKATKAKKATAKA
jgi:large subunit ribosomal protein L24